MPIEIIFIILVLGFSVILHEVAHGYVANLLGDPTARLQGRLTLNPISHIDPFGSVILPLLIAFTTPFPPLGYAKPVPYNPHNIRHKNGEALVAFAGPATNILLALIFGLIVRFLGGSIDTDLSHALSLIVFINIALATFNLIPVPPFDGSKVFSILLPGSLRLGYESIRLNFERMGFFVNLLIIFTLITIFGPSFSALVLNLFYLVVGVGYL